MAKEFDFLRLQKKQTREHSGQFNLARELHILEKLPSKILKINKRLNFITENKKFFKA